MLATIVAVAVVAHELVDGLPWPAAFMLGAIVAPTDPVAALATFRRLGVPERVRLLVEGESMINDATALVAFRIALAAAIGGTFGVADAGAGPRRSPRSRGIAVGLAAGWLEVHVLRSSTTGRWRSCSRCCPPTAPTSRRRSSPSRACSPPWSAACTSAGTRTRPSTPTRGSAAIAFWEVLVFVLNALLFILLGLQFPAIIDERAPGDSFGTLRSPALAIAAVIVAAGWSRVRRRSRARPTAGASGSSSAGAACAARSRSRPRCRCPRPSPAAADPSFVTFVVILVTLVGQGLTLPALLRSYACAASAPWSPDEAIARLEAAQSALDRLDELEDEGGVTEEQLRRLRELYRARFRACQAVLGGGDQDGATDVREPAGATATCGAS